ncbi:MAG: hypothetical protein U7126_06585 [Microcoleus sp.]
MKAKKGAGGETYKPDAFALVLSYPGKYPTGCHKWRSEFADAIHRQDVCAMD